jgi:hypothetical protein
MVVLRFKSYACQLLNAFLKDLNLAVMSLAASCWGNKPFQEAPTSGALMRHPTILKSEDFSF